MARKQIHVVPRGKDWAVTRPGADRASSIHKTQQAADNKARPAARKEGAELVTHGRDGKIRDSDSFGKDPNPPKDKKH